MEASKKGVEDSVADARGVKSYEDVCAEDPMEASVEVVEVFW